MPRAFQTQGQLQRPPCTKTLSSIYPNQQPHLGLPVCSLHSHRIGSDALLGTKAKLKPAPELPFTKGLVSEHWGFV